MKQICVRFIRVYFHTLIDFKSCDFCFQFCSHIFTVFFTCNFTEDIHPWLISSRASTTTGAILFYVVFFSFAGPLGTLLSKLELTSLSIFFICWCIMIAWWSTSSSYRSYRNGNVSKKSTPSCIINKDQLSHKLNIGITERSGKSKVTSPYQRTEVCRSCNSFPSQTESIEKQGSEINTEEVKNIKLKSWMKTWSSVRRSSKLGWLQTKKKSGRSFPHEMSTMIDKNWFNLSWRIEAIELNAYSSKMISGISKGGLKINSKLTFFSKIKG